MAAPNLPTLLPTAYSSQTGTAWGTTTVGNIDNGVATPSGTFIVAGANSNSSIFYAFTAMPADFAKIKTLAYDIRYQLAGNTNDPEALFIQVFAADKTTAYTNEAQVASTSGNITLTNKGSTAFTVNSTGLAATKAQWDAAFIRIRTTHSANMGADGSVWSIDEVEMTGTYDAPPTTVLGNPADAATGQSVTPTLAFTGTDPNGDAVEYQVQVDTSSSFDSQPGGFSLKYVDLFIFQNNSPADTLVLTVSESDFEVDVLGTSDTVSPPQFTTGEYVRFTFATPIALVHGGTYFLVVRRPGARSTSQNFEWARSSTDVIASAYRGTRNSGSWTTDGNGYDMRFRLFDDDGNLRFSQDSGTTSVPIYGDGGTSERLGQEYPDLTGAPLLNKLSSVPDPGFPSGHPFASGVEKTYEVQSGDELDPSTEYFWRVRAIDPSGSNTWGAWSSTRSFTTEAGTPPTSRPRTYAFII